MLILFFLAAFLNYSSDYRRVPWRGGWAKKQTVLYGFFGLGFFL